MKKLLLTLFVVCGINLSASHLMGGVIGVFQTSQDSTTIGMALISDGNTPIPMPTTLYVERWEMNSVGWYVQNGTITMSKVTTATHQGQTLTNYTSEYLDLDSNKYRFIYKNCCWGMINNSTNSMNSEFVISADYWHIPYNSTPYVRMPFSINQQNGIRNTMKPLWGWNALLVNPDSWGDVVTITQSDVYGGYANGTFVQQSFTPLNMNVSNDSISWIPNGLGNYATGFEIADYRNGDKIGIQRIQWTFIVVPSTIGIEENKNNLPITYKIWDMLGKVIYVGKDIPYERLKGLYVVQENDSKPYKLFINNSTL